jgi:heme A synthase
MKVTTRTLGLPVISLMLLTAITAYADIARPKPSPAAPEPKYVTNTGMQIVPDAKAYGARLQISQATLNQLRETMNAGTTSRSFTERIVNGSTNTIMAGLFLFMSLSFAGVWLARSNSKGRNHKAAAAALMIVAVVGVAAIITRANTGPPPGWAWRNLPKNLNDGKGTTGSVDIEIVPDGVGVKLIVPVPKNPS